MAMMTTAEDLCSFTWHVFRGDLLNQVSMDEMYTFHPINFLGFELDYGLGVSKSELFGEEILSHGGSMIWYTSYTAYNPRFDVAISVLVNQDPYNFNFPNSGPIIATKEIFRVLLNYITSLPEEKQNIPDKFTLSQNYPNPFNPETIISYQLPVISKVTLKIFDVLGREITTLVNKEQPQSNYKVEFDASNLSSGIYFYRIQTGKFIDTKKMLLLR